MRSLLIIAAIQALSTAASAQAVGSAVAQPTTLTYMGSCGAPAPDGSGMTANTISPTAHALMSAPAPAGAQPAPAAPLKMWSSLPQGRDFPLPSPPPTE